MKIYLVEVLEDPVLFIYLYDQYLLHMTYPILVANVGFVGNYLLKIYLVEVLEDPVLFIYLYDQYLLLFITYEISHAFANLGFKDLIDE